MNRYLLQEELGDGTFGTVFRATRRHDNKVVSKYFHPNAISLLIFIRDGLYASFLRFIPMVLYRETAVESCGIGYTLFLASRHL
jgi:hypothetical protein